MTAYIILIVVVVVLLLGGGRATLLPPRGMHGVRRGRARELDLTGPLPKASDSSSSGGGTATATAPPPGAELLAPPEAAGQQLVGGWIGYRYRAPARVRAARPAGARAADAGEAAALGRADGPST